MRRVVAVVIGLSALLSALIGLRIRAQQRALSGPPAGSGVIEAEHVELASRLSARVVRVLASEGQQVEPGAVLVELSCDEPHARLAEAEARLRAARDQGRAALAQAEAALGQREAAKAHVAMLGAQLGALETQHALAARDAQRLEQMGTHAAEATRDRARSTALGLAEQERAARASRMATHKQAAASSAQALAAEAQASAALENVHVLDAQVKSARLMVDECTLRAPRAGVIERIYYEPGELVLPGATIARLVDPSSVHVIFYLASADIAHARVGSAARIEADAYPGRTFAGRVSRVALEAEFTPRNVQTRSDRDRLVFPIEVQVSEQASALRTGMPATVTLSAAELP